MVYVVERYLPGLDQRQLLHMLEKLGQVTRELSIEGTHVRYLGVPFARIVAAITVPVAADNS